ncbi:MAG TPA: efflux RND transporter periplasmic adaptor subunit [Verrucomicrobiae bacterium]|nr:efflux RND transporter periplasmic adaptor subunit [Verrucomicrobiae bacterium]
MKRLRPVLAILIIVAIAAGIWFWHSHEQAASSNQLVLYGNVDIRQVQLAFNNSERIAKILVREGDRVKTGQLLAELNKQRLEARFNSRQAHVTAQHEVVARLEAGNRPEEIRKAKADMEAAKADLENAQQTYDRVSRLVGQNVDTQQRADDARAALDVAKAHVTSTTEAYNLMVLGPRKEDIAAAKATLQANEADLALAQRELADAKLYSPTNGVIQNRLLEPGDMASPQKPVFTLALDDPLWIRAYVPETDLGKIRLGMKAEVTADSFAGKKYDGWIGFISPTAEFTPKTVETTEVRTRLVYQVRVFVHNPQGELRLGMPAVATIPLNQPETTGSDAGDKPSGK